MNVETTTGVNSTSPIKIDQYNFSFASKAMPVDVERCVRQLVGELGSLIAQRALRASVSVELDGLDSKIEVLTDGGEANERMRGYLNRRTWKIPDEVRQTRQLN